MAKTTEPAINDLMSDYLHSRGLSIRTGASILDASGTPRYPDFILTNSGTFYGEGEFEDTAWLGFGQARDYSTSPGSAGGFILIYPQSLRKVASKPGFTKLEASEVLGSYRYDVAFLRPGRTTDLRPGLRLEQIPEWLHKSIHETTRPGLDIPHTIKLLHQAVDALTEFLPLGVQETPLFENLLGREPDKPTALKATRQAAAYILLNQLMFYRVLSATSPEKYPGLVSSSIEKPTDLTQHFPMTGEFESVFGLDVASQFKRGTSTTLQNVVKLVEALSPEKIGGASLGKLFHGLIPLDIRKHVAAYYTLEDAAALLAHLCIEDAGCKVLDPACGSGTLLVAAYERKRQLIEGKAREFSRSDHARLLKSDLTGLDIMPFAAHMTSLNLVLRDPGATGAVTRVAIADSTALGVGSRLEALHDVLPRARAQRKLDDFPQGIGLSPKRVKAGKVSPTKVGNDEPLTLEAVDCVLMNPPFTRFQRLASFYDGYTTDVGHSFAAYESYIDGRMPYCNFFVFLADKFLSHAAGARQPSRIGAVLPATVLRGDSSEGLRRFIGSEYAIDYVIRRRFAANFSEDTEFTEVLLVMTRRAPSEPTSYVILDSITPDSWKLLTEARSRLLANGKNFFSGGSFEIRQVNLTTIGASNWFRPFALSDHSLQQLGEKLRSADGFTALSELASDLQSKDQSEAGGLTFPRVSLNSGLVDQVRGDTWIIESSTERAIEVRNTETSDRLNVPRTCVKPLFRRFRYRGWMDVSRLEEFVPATNNRLPQDFRSLSRIQGDLSWTDWGKYLESRTANLLLVDRVNLSAPGTCLLSYYSNPQRIWARVGTVIKGLTDEQAKLLCLWFNSSFGLVSYLRDQVPTQGAFMQLSKFVYSAFFVPDVRDVSSRIAELGSKVFDAMTASEFPSLITQFCLLSSPPKAEDRVRSLLKAYLPPGKEFGEGFSPRLAIDEFVLEWLGLVQKSDLSGWIYNAILQELTTLKEVIQGRENEDSGTD